MINLSKESVGANSYEGTIVSAVYNKDLTYKWGKGARGFTLHIFITKVNGESIYSVMGIPKALIEINVYSNGPDRYDYLDKNTGYIHSRYLKLTSPLYMYMDKAVTSTRDVYISKNLTQKISISSLSKLTPKKHKKQEGYYHMNDNETMFYTLKRPLIKDLWVVENTLSPNSSNSIGQKVLAVV